MKRLVYLLCSLALVSCGEKEKAEQSQKKDTIAEQPLKYEEPESYTVKADTVSIIKEPEVINVVFSDTIIKSGNYKFILSNTELDSLPNPYTIEELAFKKVKDSINYHYSEAEKHVEAFCLNQTGGLVARKDDKLLFTLDNGTSYSLKNKETGDGERAYYYEQFFKNINQHLIYVQCWEGGNYSLLNNHRQKTDN